MPDEALDLEIAIDLALAPVWQIVLGAERDDLNPEVVGPLVRLAYFLGREDGRDEFIAEMRPLIEKVQQLAIEAHYRAAPARLKTFQGTLTAGGS